MSYYNKRNSVANSTQQQQQFFQQPHSQTPINLSASKRYSNVGPVSMHPQAMSPTRRSSTQPPLRSVTMDPKKDKMMQIENLYVQSNANQEVMVYEVEVVDAKREQEYQITKAAERGLCICRRWHFLLAGNFIILLLCGVAIGVTLILNNAKDITKVPLTFNDTCNPGSTDCDIKADLKCPSGLCVCNSNKGWNGTDCVCPNNQYWDGYNCLTNKNYTETCSSSVPCLNYLYCNGSICQCTYSKYFVNNTCVNKLPINSTCSSFIQCQDYLGATCLSNKCQCTSKYYWDGTACVSKKLNGSSCTENIQCDDTVTLYCTNTGSGSLCLCNSTWYWEAAIPSCQPTKPYFEPCTYTFECISSKNLICQNTNNACNCPYTSAVGVCDCPTTRFWDDVTCALRNSYNGSCIADYACVAGKNLKCSFGFCVCLSPYPSWNGANCV